MKKSIKKLTKEYKKLKPNCKLKYIKEHYARKNAWALLRIGGHTQCDYIFIDFLFWSIRITRKAYRTGQFKRT